MICDLNEGEPYMEVYDGSQFTVGSVEENEYRINTIAHSLSNICRYGGHSKKFYSVAEHSIIMADHVYDTTGDKVLAYEALMHDAAEAYMGDIPRPLKYRLPDYLDTLAKVEKSIAEKFNFPYPTSKSIKELDARMIKTERKQVMRPSGNKWFHDSLEPLNIRVHFQTPVEAKECFLDAYEFYHR